jgi:hypothetical protein
MQTPTQYPTWATTSDGQAVFIPDQASFNQAVKPVAAGGIGATWSSGYALRYTFSRRECNPHNNSA